MEEHQFIEQLISLVQNNKILYDKREKCYYNTQVKQKLWSDIARECERTESECKHRWKLLRERFTKELRKNEQHSGSGQLFREPWCYLESLKFLTESITKSKRPFENSTMVFTSAESAESTELNFENSCFQDIDIIDSADISSHNSTLKKKQATVDSLFGTLERASSSIKSAVADLRPPPQRSAIRATLDTIEILLNDLPQSIQDEFLKKMYVEVMDLRMEARNNGKF